MFSKGKYGKILVPMVTPFKEDQSVNYDAAVSIAETLILKDRADSIILSGTTGEFFSMSYSERVKIFQILMEEVGDKIPLIAGTGASSTMETIQLSKKAEELGYELVMVLAPYFTKPNQKELYNHFKRIAESIDIPMILYNIPIFVGVNIEPETVAKLAQIDNIVGIKEEAELNPKQITEFINCTPDEFIIYNGDDTMVLEAFAQGANHRIGGVVSGASHIIGERIRLMIETFLNGDVKNAANTQQQFLKLYRSWGQNGRTNPVALLKASMKMVGYDAGIPRLPLSSGTKKEITNVKKIMQELDIL